MSSLIVRLEAAAAAAATVAKQERGRPIGRERMWEAAQQDGAARGAGIGTKRLEVLEATYNVMCCLAESHTCRGEVVGGTRHARLGARACCMLLHRCHAGSSSRKQRLPLRKGAAPRQVATDPGPFHQAPYNSPAGAWIAVMMPWHQQRRQQQSAINGGGAAVGPKARAQRHSPLLSPTAIPPARHDL